MKSDMGSDDVQRQTNKATTRMERWEVRWEGGIDKNMEG